MDVLHPALLFTVLPLLTYLGSRTLWRRLSPLWQRRLGRALHVYASLTLPVVLYTLWGPSPSYDDAELAASALGSTVMTLLIWPLFTLPIAALLSWGISLVAESRRATA